MHDNLFPITGQRPDPCLLHHFSASVRFVAGEPKYPWWECTAEGKPELVARSARSQ
jgi:Pathogenicity locus